MYTDVMSFVLLQACSVLLGTSVQPYLAVAPIVRTLKSLTLKIDVIESIDIVKTAVP